MREVKEIWFIIHDEDEQEQRWPKLFDKIENLLDDFGIMPDVAEVTRHEVMMEVALDRDFFFGDALKMLKSLEEIFEVTSFEYETESDAWDESSPHVKYIFKERK